MKPKPRQPKPVKAWAILFDGQIVGDWVRTSKQTAEYYAYARCSKVIPVIIGPVTKAKAKARKR